MALVIWGGVFLLSIILLVKSADWFTIYAEKLGLLFNMPAFLVGVVIVAVGTSLPELATSVLAVLGGEPEIVLGNVFGSDITNILLGLGFAAVVAKTTIKSKVDIFFLDFPVFVAVLLVFGFMAIDGSINIFESILLIIGLALYFFYSARAHKTAEKDAFVESRNKKKNNGTRKAAAKAMFYALLSLVGVVIASKYVVDSVIAIATIMNLATSVLAASIIALGTSLPEIMVAAVAAYKGKFELLAGNIIGSNIFNIVGVVGISGLFGTLTISADMLMFLLSFLVATVVLYWAILQDGKINKVEGAFLLLVYVVFFGKLFNFF